VPKRDSERRSFKSDKAAKARYLLGVGSLEQAQLLAEQALAKAAPIFGSRSVASSSAAFARTGVRSSLLALLNTSYPAPPNGTKPRPVSNPIIATAFGLARPSRMQQNR